MKLDLVGVVLLAGGLAMTLIPITIAGRKNTDEWREASSIALIIVGVLTFAAFLLWDGKFASNPIIPYHTIKERNVTLACVFVAVIAISDSIYRPFLSSFLQVAGDYSPGAAIRVDNAQRVAYNIGAIVCGFCLKFSKHTKPFTILGTILIVLAAGLPIYLTNIAGSHIANEPSFIASKSLLGVGRGFAQVSLQVALQAVLRADQIAIATALYLSALGFGSSLGTTISGGIWNSLLPKKLGRYFAGAERQKIFGSIVVAQSYVVGSPERIGIDECYRETQRTLAIGSVGVALILLPLVFWIRDVDLKAEDERRDAQADEELASACKARDIRGEETTDTKER